MHAKNLIESSIDSLTAEQIQERIKEYIGCEPPKVNGYLILVALATPDEKNDTFKRSDGTSSLIQMPETMKEKLKYSACTGMVIAMGPEAYQDTRRFPLGPWCRLGEWVCIPRHEGVQIHYRGKVMHWLPDDKIAMTIDDPSYVVRG